MNADTNEQTSITVAELQEFVELELDDPILMLDSENNLTEYVQKHLLILHELIMDEITLAEALRQLGELDL